MEFDGFPRQLRGVAQVNGTRPEPGFDPAREMSGIDLGLAYEFRHVVTFEETNLVGNVYYVNHLRWQGHCREMFLREYAPGILQELENDLCLVTARCSCDYLAELAAFQEVVLRMRLKQMVQNRIHFDFEYLRCANAGEELVARGEQEVLCMQRRKSGLSPIAIPEQLRLALQPFLRPYHGMTVTMGGRGQRNSS
jgi:enediyne biosynthesis thioesterase